MLLAKTTPFFFIQCSVTIKDAHQNSVKTQHSVKGVVWRARLSPHFPPKSGAQVWSARTILSDSILIENKMDLIHFCEANASSAQGTKPTKMTFHLVKRYFPPKRIKAHRNARLSEKRDNVHRRKTLFPPKTGLSLKRLCPQKRQWNTEASQLPPKAERLQCC